MNKPHITILVAAALALGACAQGQSFSGWLGGVNDKVTKYAPIVGNDLLLVGNILVTAECSPLTQVAGKAVTNVLSITAPNSSAADTVSAILATNAAVAAQLCPLVSAIKASVGTVPAGNPVATVTASGAAGVSKPLLIIKNY